MNVDQPSTNIDHNLPELSVGEISATLKATVEGAFQRVRVRGEVSGFKRAPSGHLYMTLKDDTAVLDAVCWRGTVARLRVLPEDGLEVIATGRLTTYAGRSKYQIVVESFELAGEGALLKLLENRRLQLSAEGLFKAERKRAIPFLPDVIGVVTSPTGAVIRDILHRLADRFPRRVLIWPVLVQGDGAASQLAEAIEGFNAFDENGNVPKPDVLIVARGGGSVEDLWAFNEELVVRAAANSGIPVISAIGHETDTTLIDFVADLRAPTPSAAAEMVVPVRSELHTQVSEEGISLIRAITRRLESLRLRVDALARGLPDPQYILGDRSQRLDDWDERLRNSLRIGLRARLQNLHALSGRFRKPENLILRAKEWLAGESRQLARIGRDILKDRTNILNQKKALLESYSFERILERGFVLISNAEGKSVASVKNLKTGDNIGLRFSDGIVSAAVTGSKDDVTEKSSPSTRKKKNMELSVKRQGKLL